MRVVILLVWVAVAATLVERAPAPVVVLLVLQAAVCFSYLLSLISRRNVVADLVERIVPAAASVGRGVDVLVDGAIDGVGMVVRAWSAVLRHAQAGSVRVHAAAALAAVLGMIGYLLWL